MVKEKPKSTKLRSLIRLQDRSVREALVDAHIRNGIAFQVRSMRRTKGWTQEQLAHAVGTKSTQIGRVENPDYGSHTVRMLRRIASVFDVAVVVRFVPYSELLRWDAGPRNLAPTTFWQELQDSRTEEASRSAISAPWVSCAIDGRQSNVRSIQTPLGVLFAKSTTSARQEIDELSGGRYAAAKAG